MSVRGKRVGSAVLLLLAIAGCSDAKPTAGVVPETRAPVAPVRTATPVRPTPAPVQVKPGTSTNPQLKPGTSTNLQVMPLIDHGPRDKKQIALTFDADLTALMRKRLVSGKVKSYYNKALIDELRALHVP